MDKQEAETFRQVAFASLRAVCAPGTTRFWTESSPEVEDLFNKHQTWRGVAKELKTSTGRLYLIREGLSMISSQNHKKKEKELSE